MNSFAFHAVIDGIYSDKIAAPVREYSTNAYDAHRMVGKDDVPFELMAPSSFHPYFMVRDFGPGMTHDEVMDRATTMFASDKRDTNNQVGMLGLGMKSGFAYTKQYSITCYDGEEQRDYVCFLDDTGAPTVTAMAPVPSTEPRGVKVTFPVRQGDIPRFRHAISKVMIGFDPMPKVINDQWQPARPTITMEGSNFRIVKSDHIGSPHIRQGCVLYPLDVAQIDENYTYEDRQVPIIIDVPIGTASVSTSRESIGYDAVTKQNLAEAYRKARAEIRERLQETLDEPDDFHDACIRYRELRRQLHDSLMKGPMRWRDTFVLRPHFHLDGSPSAQIRVNLLQPGDPLEWDNSSNRTRRRTREFDIELFKGAVIALDKTCTQGKDRLRRYRQDNPDRTVLWVKKGDAVEQYGIDEVVDLATIEPLKLPTAVEARLRPA